MCIRDSKSHIAVWAAAELQSDPLGAEHVSGLLPAGLLRLSGSTPVKDPGEVHIEQHIGKGGNLLLSTLPPALPVELVHQLVEHGAAVLLELSALFKRLYEDNVLGRVSDEQFRMLSADYNAEQKNLSADIPAKEEQLEKLKASAANVDAFIEKAKRYTTIDELTPELLRLFIQRIEVGERSQKYSRSAGQSVKIVYRDIGRVDSPMQEGEHAPHITKQITDIEEIKRLLA